MDVQENFSLKTHHTFGMEVQAAAYASITSEDDLQKKIPIAKPFLILGGGSNLLFTKDFDGLILHNQIKGIELVQETENDVFLKIGGGEIWHDLVLWCIERNYAGIENLSLIPGTVGAAPIQNIGAYGVELKDVFDSLEAIHLQNGRTKIFKLEDCKFGYRNSVFKQEFKSQYFITRVILRLSKFPQLNLSYGAIVQTMKEIAAPSSIRGVSDAVITIRQQKLPDPKKIGNSGSFFKNPTISQNHFEILQKKYPKIVAFPVNEKEVKIAAGWLIESLGWKGYRKGDAGVHEHQALVLVNYGNAKGNEVWALAQEIQKDIKRVYNIDLEAEVNVV